MKLSSKLKMQVDSKGVERILFYGPSPKMMKCYLGVLHYTFNQCNITHSWKDLINHVKQCSNKIKLISKVKNIL